MVLYLVDQFFQVGGFTGLSGVIDKFTVELIEFVPGLGIAPDATAFALNRQVGLFECFEESGGMVYGLVMVLELVIPMTLAAFIDIAAALCRGQGALTDTGDQAGQDFFIDPAEVIQVH